MIMKIKKHRKIIIITIIIMLIIATLYYLSTSMRFLPKGSYLETQISPNNEYRLNAYFIDGGPLSGDAIRVEIVNNKNNKSKNIYWSYPESKVSMKWINNDIVEINGKQLNIKKNEFCKSCNRYKK